jgi:hypothetical protein
LGSLELSSSCILGKICVTRIGSPCSGSDRRAQLERVIACSVILPFVALSVDMPSLRMKTQAVTDSASSSEWQTVGKTKQRQAPQARQVCSKRSALELLIAHALGALRHRVDAQPEDARVEFACMNITVENSRLVCLYIRARSSGSRWIFW